MHPCTQIGSIRVESLTGVDAIAPVIPDLARLRVSVFREYPYLYDGSLAYEANYLKRYAATFGAVVVIARDIANGARIVGAATALPLAAEHAELLTMFHAAAIYVDQFYYCAESVLEPSYRRRGIGHAFFDHRERQAQQLGFAETCFFSVVRPDDHPRRPADYRPHDRFWSKRGYRKLNGFEASFTWRDLDDSGATPKPMALWRRALAQPSEGTPT